MAYLRNFLIYVVSSRGWDDGGVDSGRVLFSVDSVQNITGTMLDISVGPNNNVSGAFSVNTLTPNLSSTPTGRKLQTGKLFL
jgi:hypothetical protein